MLLISVVFLAGIFILNLTFGMRHGFGYRHYWFFELLHFLGGFFVAMFFSSFFNSRLSILLGLAAATFIWELAEYLIAKSPPVRMRLKRIFKGDEATYEWGDGLLDIVLNFAGAALFLYLF